MTIKKRSDGRYEGRITVNKIRKSFYGNTKSEVKQKAKEYLIKIEAGYIEPEKIILNDYIEYWLQHYKLNKIEPTSYTRLYRVYKCQIHDTIGKMHIGEITTKDIQKLIDEYANPHNDNKSLARSGLKRILHLLRPCLNIAVKEGIIQNNPCIDVLLPVESCIKKETKEQFSLSDNEICMIRKAALEKYKTTYEYKSRDAFIILIILNLGLRVSEMLALTWDDIDLEKKIVKIHKTIQSNIMDFNNEHNTTTYNRIKNSPKTKSGKRVLALNDSVIYYFNELIEYNKRNNIISKWVCSTNVGTLNSARNLQRSLDRLINRTEINKNVTLHTLRHTFGSTLVRNGIGIETVSKLMGHSNITITYLKYIHVLQEQEIKAMQNIKIC